MKEYVANPDIAENGCRAIVALKKLNGDLGLNVRNGVGVGVGGWGGDGHQHVSLF
jgi:hypothetical protein